MAPDRRRPLLSRLVVVPLLRAVAVAAPFALTLAAATPADGGGTRLARHPAVTVPRGPAAHAAAPAPRSRPLPWLVPPVMAAGRPFGGTPAVGALFAPGGSSALGTHFCSASVIGGPSGNLVLTAAHCLAGEAVGQLSFVPGYHDGQAPYGVWPVTRAVTDRRWAGSADPDDDFAFLQVRPPAALAWGARLQDITGGERLGGEPASAPVTVIGYPNYHRAPVYCRNHARPFGRRQLEFDCAGYTEGTSGSPLLAGLNPLTGLGSVVAVIGGYERGGHTSDVSYAARFGGAVAALYRAAAALPAPAAAVGGRAAAPPAIVPVTGRAG